jgi:hypothetical protein
MEVCAGGAASTHDGVAAVVSLGQELRANTSPGVHRWSQLQQPAPLCVTGRRLEANLGQLVRAHAPLRRAMVALASRLVLNRSWERLGFARLRDYATERLGLSARSIHDLAHVHGALTELPRIEAAFVSGELPWTAVRLLARVATAADEREWLDRARTMPAAGLAREVRRVDVGALERGGFDADDDEEGTDSGGAEVRENVRENIMVRCTPQVQGKWHRARQLAWRVVGNPVQPWECLEMVTAEVLSALPVDAIADGDTGQKNAESEHEHVEPRSDEDVGRLTDGPNSAKLSEGERRGAVTDGLNSSKLSEGERRGAVEQWRSDRHEECESAPWLRALASSLLVGIDAIGAFQLDRRLRRAVRLEQRLDAELGARLALAAHEHLRLVHGIPRFDVYVRERFGLAPRKVRALLRLERARRVSPALSAAYRDGRLSWVQAHALLPVLLIPHARPASDAWVAWATQVSVRRLQEDVDRALLLNEMDPAAFVRGAGLPEAARGASAATDGVRPLTTSEAIAGEAIAGIESFAARSPAPGIARPTGGHRDGGGPGDDESTASFRMPRPGGSERQIRAHRTTPAETSMVFVHAPRAVARLARTVLCTVRREIERRTGRLPTEGEAFEVMLEHAVEAWAPPGSRTRATHRIFERDGWRCTVPGCSSFRNLHDHHIVFRSAGGSDDPANRTTLCVFHHLRGVHAGIVRCTGAAPDGLRFELGARADGPPLMTFEPGERIDAGVAA